jgi:Ca2+-binding RTX toxin-like protein
VRTSSRSFTQADAEDRIIYNTTNDTLLYDRDGTGAAAAVAFAHVNGNPLLTKADFVVVA